MGFGKTNRPADPEQWVVDWYKRHGFIQRCVYDDGMVGLTFDLNNGR